MADLPTAGATSMLNAAPTPTGTTYFMGLNTGDPGTTGANEVSGGSYLRQAITFGSASAGVQTSTNSQSFAGMPAEAGGVPYFSLWSTTTGGTYMGGGQTSGLSGSISSGTTITFNTGGVTLTVS